MLQYWNYLIFRNISITWSFQKYAIISKVTLQEMNNNNFLVFCFQKGIQSKQAGMSKNYFAKSLKVNSMCKNTLCLIFSWVIASFLSHENILLFLPILGGTMLATSHLNILIVAVIEPKSFSRKLLPSFLFKLMI